MTLQKAIAGCSIALCIALAGCKEDQKEKVASGCASPANAEDSAKCARSEENITRSKPEEWSLGQKSQ